METHDKTSIVMGLIVSFTIIACVALMTSCNKHISDNNMKVGRETDMHP